MDRNIGQHMRIVFLDFMMDSSGPSKTVVCPHCSQRLSVKTYKAHRRVYFDSATNVWCKKRTVEPPEVDFTENDILTCFESGSCEENEGKEQPSHSINPNNDSISQKLTWTWNNTWVI